MSIGVIRDLGTPTKGADSAGSPGYDFLRGQGVKWISKYTYHINLTNAQKTWKPLEARLYAAQGFAIMYNAEWDVKTTLGGYNQQNIDLAKGNKWIMDRDSCPDNMVSWYSHDTAFYEAIYSKVSDAYKAYRDYDPRPKGAYAPYDLGCRLQDDGLIEYIWIPNATSWGKTAFPNQDRSRPVDPSRVPRAHIQQGYWQSSGIDPNWLLQPTPFWFPLEDPTPPPPPPPPPPSPTTTRPPLPIPGAAQTGEDVLYVLAPNDVNARFLGVGVNGYVPVVEWIGPDTLRSFGPGATELPCTSADLLNCTLLGPVPQEEGAAWARDNFRNVIP